MSDVKYIVTADTKGAVTEIKKVDESIDGMKQQAEKSKSPLQGMFKQLAIGLGGVVALRKAYRTLTQFMGSCIDKAIEQEQVTTQLEARLKSTKGAAGLTKDELLKMASGLQAVTTYGDETIISAENLLLTFKDIGKDVFPDALETVLDMSTALGQDLKSSAVQLGKALNDPIEGVTALKRVGVSFTDAQREQIKVLVESGNTLDAQKLILQELQTEFGGASRAAAKDFGGSLKQLAGYWGDVKEKLGTAITENEAIKDLIGDLKDEIIILIETGKIEEWAETASKAISGLVWAFREFKDEVTEFKPLPVQMAEGMATWTMNMIGLKSPQQEMNALQKEATLQAIEFKNSLKELSPSMDEIREHFEKGKEHANAWMQQIREADEKAAAFSGTIKTFKEWWEDTNEAWEAAHPVIKTTTELIETGVHPALKNLINILETMKGVQPVLKDTFEEAIPPARDFAGIVLDNVQPSLEGASTETEDFGKTTQDVVSDSKSLWDEMADGLKTKWATNFSDMLSGATSFKDGFKGILDGLKEQFFDILGQMLAKWTTDFLGGLLGSAKEAGGGILNAITGGGGGAGGVGGLAAGAAGATPWGAIAMGAGALLGTLLGGGGGPSSTDSWHFEHIWMNSTALYPILTENQGIHNETILIRNNTLNTCNKLNKIINFARQIEKNTSGTVSAQGGFYGTLRRDVTIRAHKGEDVAITPRGRRNSLYKDTQQGRQKVHIRGVINPLKR